MDTIDQNLLNEIIKKSGLSKSTIYRRIVTYEIKYVIDKRISCLLVAREYRIKIEKYLQPNDRAIIQTLIGNSITKDEQKTEKSNQNSKEIIERKRDRTSAIPIVPNTYIEPKDIINAQKNADIYPIIFLFENSVRRFIDEAMKKEFGNDWWKVKIENEKPEIARNLDIRRNTEKRYPWHSTRISNPIYYTDIKDLIKIINSYGQIGSFNLKLDGNKAKVIFWIDEIEKTRNILAHSNPVSKKDRERLELYAHDWYKFIASRV